jgi:dTDP-4-dehydrorhamnose reductase
MRILVLGRNGQVGGELQRALAPLGDVLALDRAVADLSRPESLPPVVREVRPEVIVNAAAYTAVDRAESERALAFRVNAEAVDVLARSAAERGALLVHYSTDYVFDGSGSRPWREDDPTGPLGVYGASKLAGEQAIAGSGCRHLILRTSWVYAARGHNFVCTMLRLASERDDLRVVHDQYGAPTPAALLADVTAAAISGAAAGDAGVAGTFHVCPRGETTWHGVATAALRAAEARGVSLSCPPDRVVAIPTSDFPTPARRPPNSRLCVDRIERALGIALPDWHDLLPGVVAEIVR